MNRYGTLFFSFSFQPRVDASRGDVRACVRCLYSHISSTGTFRSALTASLDSFSGVTRYGRVWTKVPECEARSVPVTLSHSRLGTKLKENRTEQTSWSGKFKLRFGGSIYIHAKELVLFFSLPISAYQGAAMMVPSCTNNQEQTMIGSPRT